MSSLLCAREGIDTRADEFPYVLECQLGDAEYASGDSIKIREVRGNRPAIMPGGTYCVEGDYTLDSREEASLAFFATTMSTNSTRIDPRQMVRIKKGTGSFRLIKPMTEDGYLHLSFYPVQSGGAFGGVYFGQGNWVLHNKKWSYSQTQNETGSPMGEAGTQGGPNRVMMEYLGDPVSVPAKMDESYTKEGLIKGIHLAASRGNISLKSVEVEDSEFPFLLGLVCPDDEWERLKEQIRKMTQYEYQGSIGGHDLYTINIVPRRTYPADASQRINRRVMLRNQIFHDKLSSRD